MQQKYNLKGYDYNLYTLCIVCKNCHKKEEEDWSEDHDDVCTVTDIVDKLMDVVCDTVAQYLTPPHSTDIHFITKLNTTVTAC